MSLGKRLINPSDAGGGGGNPTVGGNNIEYIGNGGTNYSISTLGIQPDFLWIKCAGSAQEHVIFDSIRGGEFALDSALQDDARFYANAISSFDENGFTLGNYHFQTNISGVKYRAFGFAAGGPTTVTNNNGSIQSQVSASVEGGFSIVKYDGNGLANQTIGHGLDAAPDLVIIKANQNNKDWKVYTKGLPVGYTLVLNNENAQDNQTDRVFPSYPTSSVINIGYDSTVNIGSDYTAYCWTAKAGISSFGTFTGNSSTNGPTITTGFLPRFIMLKKVSGVASWFMFIPEVGCFLQAEDNRNEISCGYSIQYLATGFKIISGDGTLNSGTVAYWAFA